MNKKIRTEAVDFLFDAILSLKDKEESWYEMPSNVVGVLVDPISGELATEKSKNKKASFETLFF